MVTELPDSICPSDCLSLEKGIQLGRIFLLGKVVDTHSFLRLGE